MAKVIKGAEGKIHFFLKSHKGQDGLDENFSKGGIFIKMFGVLLLLCLIYIPIVQSLGDAGLQYPGYLH